MNITLVIKNILLPSYYGMIKLVSKRHQGHIFSQIVESRQVLVVDRNFYIDSKTKEPHSHGGGGSVYYYIALGRDNIYIYSCSQSLRMHKLWGVPKQVKTNCRQLNQSTEVFDRRIEEIKIRREY